MIRAPLVVGYKGEIGRFLLAGLLEDQPKANDIYCVDVNNSEEDVRERIAKSDFIFLCVPLQHTASWLTTYGDCLGEVVIVEQCSVKSFLYDSMDFATLKLLSMHLLFRPSATPVSDAGVVSDFADYVGRAFKTSVVELRGGGEPAHVVHDRLMARHQALVHRVVLALASRLDAVEARTFVGQRVSELADRIKAGDPVLYKMIQENPMAAGELEEFIETLQPVQEPSAKPYLLEDASFKGKPGLQPGIDPTNWPQIRDAAYEEPGS
jgi:prephenate dehydrogenase